MNKRIIEPIVMLRVIKRVLLFIFESTAKAGNPHSFYLFWWLISILGLYEWNIRNTDLFIIY